MKICILTQWMDTYGGLQRVVCDIANKLSQDNSFDVNICALDGNNIYYRINENINVDYKYEYSYKKRGIINKLIGYFINKGIISIGNKDLLKRIFFPKKRILKLQEYISTNKFDCVIAVSSELTMYLSLVNYNCKKIGWQHNEYNAYFKTKGKYSYGLEGLAKDLYKNLNSIVVLTNHMANDYKNYMGIETTVIHNPLGFNTILKSEQNNDRLLFVGRLVKKNKGLDFLIEILNRLDTINKSWECVIVGDGPDRDYLENELNNHNLNSKVKIVGEKKDILNYYLESSILMNTSRWEGFGLTLIEAMECGVAPISFNHDGGKELIKHNENGILVNMYNTEDYATEINKLLKDKNTRIKLAKAAEDKAKEFDADIIVEQWKKILFK